MLREELKHVLRFLGSNDESMSVWCAESEMMNEQLLVYTQVYMYTGCIPGIHQPRI